MDGAIATDRAALPAHHRVWRRAAMFIVLTFALAALASSEALHSALIDVLSIGEALIVKRPIIGALSFVLLAAITAMLALVSIAVVLPVAVYTWGVPLSIFLLWVGWLLGGVACYALGRYPGGAVARWLSLEGTFHRFESRIGPDAPFSLILLLQFALPSEISASILGLLRCRFSKVLPAVAIAELVYATALVSLGAGFVERRKEVVLGFGIALVLLSVTAFYGLRRKLR